MLLPLLVAAQAAEPPRRLSAVHRAVLRAASIKALRENDGMVALKRERWTEAEVDALPPDEHDYFERKSGLLHATPDFDKDIAKALCAFANSGGGHIILGVADDGTPDGLPPTVGRTPMKDWLEQKIPPLLDMPLSDFRVHEVERSTTSRIPPGKSVFVIDVGDSPLAPHQSRAAHVHYHRQGGHSVPAPSFYLELLRQRLTAPQLEFELTGVQPVQRARREGGPIVVLRLSFIVRNTGRVAAYKWRMRAESVDGLLPKRIEDFFPEPHTFPQEVSQSGVALGDMTILPSDSMTHDKLIAIQLRYDPTYLRDDPRGRVITHQEYENWLGARFSFLIATEVSPGEEKPVVLGEKLARNVLNAYLVNAGLVD